MKFCCRYSSTFDIILVGKKTDRAFTPTGLSLITIIEVKISADSFVRFALFVVIIIIIIILLLLLQGGIHTPVTLVTYKTKNWFHTRTHIRQLIRELSLLCVLLERVDDYCRHGDGVQSVEIYLINNNNNNNDDFPVRARSRYQ